MRTWIFCTTGKWIAWMARMTKTANSTVGMKLWRSPPIMETLSTCCLTSWSNDSSASMPFDPRLWSNPSVQSVIFFFFFILLPPKDCRNDLGADWSHIYCWLIQSNQIGRQDTTALSKEKILTRSKLLLIFGNRKYHCDCRQLRFFLLGYGIHHLSRYLPEALRLWFSFSPLTMRLCSCSKRTWRRGKRRRLNAVEVSPPLQ